MPNKLSLASLGAALMLCAALPATSQAAKIDRATLQVLGQTVARGGDHITAPELNDLIVKEQRNFVLIDVRSAELFEEGHIKGATNVPLMMLFGDEQLTEMSKSPTVVLYADTTDRAAQAAILLRLADIEAVSLLGGLDAWAAEMTQPGSGEGGELSQARRDAILRAFNSCPRLPDATIPPLLPAVAPISPPAEVMEEPSAAQEPAAEEAPAASEPASDVPIILEGACG
jgi:rhodanese-related sulfurtransferase